MTDGSDGYMPFMQDADSRTDDDNLNVSSTVGEPLWTPLRAPLILCGIGFGGFFDGIVFHQLLRTHHMISNAGDDRIGLDPISTEVLSGLERNVLADGLFHAATYIFLLVGVSWLWIRWSTLPAVAPPRRLLVGGLLLGWGLFNVVEATVNHHLLAVHHVVEGDYELAFDLLFLATGVALVAVGRRLTTPT